MLRLRWPQILLITSSVLLFGAALRSTRPRLYEATARIALDDPLEQAKGNASLEFRPSWQNDLSRQAAELGSRTLLAEVAGPCDLATRWNVAEEGPLLNLLESRVRIVEQPDVRSLAVSARDLSSEQAASLANALADRFVARKESEIRAAANARIRRFEEEIKNRSGEVATIESRLVELGKNHGSDPGETEELRRRLVSQRHLLHSLEAKHQLSVIDAEEARTTIRLTAPAQPDRAIHVSPFWFRLPVLLFLGLIAGTVAALASAVGCSRWEAVADLLKRLEVNFAGFAPLTGRSPVSSKELPDAVFEPYRDLRNRILRLPAGDCLLLTLMPVKRAEPIAEAVVNLACVFADAGRATLVIDADFRHPSLHGFFDAAQHPGLSDFLSGEMRLEETVIRSRRSNLWFMPTGPMQDDAGGLLNGRRLGDLVRDLRSRFDFILLASPSLHEVSDGGLFASLADYTAVVTPYAGHSLKRLRETKTALETVSAALCGVILTTRFAVDPTESSKASSAPVPSDRPRFPVTESN